MRIELATTKSWTGKVWAALMFEGDSVPLGISGNDGRAATQTGAAERFTARPKQTILLRRNDERLIVAGLGKRNEYSLERVRAATARILKRCEEIGATAVGLAIPEPSDIKESLTEFVAATVEGAILSSYRFNKWRTPKPDEPPPVANLTLVFVNPKTKSAAMAKRVNEAVAKATAVNFTRDLVNEPPSLKPPEKLAEIGARLAVRGRITVKVHHRASLEKLGMGGILRVGAGSHQPPCLVHLTYTPKGRSKKTVVVIGKGITFDSGGLSLKPGSGMEYMKDDMAGAAAVLGLFNWLAKVDLPITVHGFAPLAENLPGGGAQKPGDIIRQYNGKTAEVITTDAEGRHLLADCLAYGSTLKPDLMIDIATLTGACVVALGDEVSGLLGNDPATIAKLIELGKTQGEYFWELPLFERYKQHLKSKVADLKHTGKPGVAGTIIAGLFLQEFVGEGIPWVHIDIAGPSFTKEDWDYLATGATGVPLRTIIELLRSL